MRIARIEVRRSGGALAAPVANAQARWAERSGVLLALYDDEGRVGLGEASPLPGYSPDTLADAERALLALTPEALRADDVPPVAPIEQVRALVARLPAALPSARFALETALLDLVAQRCGAPIHALFVERARPLPLAALLSARTVAAIVAEAEAAVEAGLITLKLKVGIDPLEHELALLAALRRALPADVRLRLDANGQTKVGVAALLSAVAPFAPELVEEPGPLAELRALARPAVPVALDESLQGPRAAETLAELAQLGCVRFAVLKPAALGGALACLELVRVAKAHDVEPIVTHLFDGPVGHAAAAHLAFAAQSGRTAAGLALHAGLDAWPATRFGWVAGGALLPPKSPGLLDELTRARLARGPT